MEIVEKLSEVPRWAKWLGMVGIAVLVGVGDYFVVFSPKYEQVRLLTNNVNNLKTQLRIIKNAKNDYKEIVKRIKELKQTLKELENSFPKENTGLFSFLNTINTNLVDIVDVKEGKVYDRRYYSEKEYSVTVKGKYRKVIEWLKETLKKSKALSVKSLSVQKGKEGNVMASVMFSYISVKKGE